MRTTIRLDDELLARAKELAARTHTSLNSVLEDALREMLARQERPRQQPLTLTTFGGNGLRPGADLDDTAALYDLHDHCITLEPGPRHWRLFAEVCRSADARGNLVTDAHLAALARENGSEIVTTDRDYARFAEVRASHPLA